MGIETGTAIMAGAGISAGGGILSGLMGGESGDDDISNLMGNISQFQWDRYIDIFDPIERMLAEQAAAPIEQQPGFLQSMGEISKGYGNAAANLRRTLAGRYPSGAGIETEMQKNLALGEAGAKAQNYGTYGQNRFANLMSVANLGRGLPGQAISGLSSTANVQASLANMLAQQQAGAFSSAGNSLGNMMQFYAMTQNQNQTPSAAAVPYVDPSNYWQYMGYGG